MKLRTGFVSNSSTTSFVMYGINIPEGDLYPNENDGDWEALDECWNLAEKMKLDFHHASEEGWGYYIGKDFCKTKDGEIEVEGGEIGEAFKKEIATKVEEFLKAVGYESSYKFGIYARTYSS
jgi:hypothetical protein